MLSRRGGAIVALFGMTLAGPAAAEWHRAESQHFVVYSDGRESVLRDYVRKLETFDSILRLQLPTGSETPRRLPVFLVRGRQALEQAHPYLPRYAAGVYVLSTEDIFAVAVRNSADDYVLHEYVHHLMFQNFADAYPAWLVEGFAEYYATAEVADDSVTIGGFNPGRVAILDRDNWIPVRDLLTTPFREARGSARESYYPVAWLLTHWFIGSGERQSQLQAYLTDVAAGTPSVEAMQKATGMSPEQIEQQLRRYFRSSVPTRRYDVAASGIAVSVTTLPESADDLLLINQRLRIPTPVAERAALVADVRRRAGRYPDDPLALLALGHAEVHFGDPAAGEVVLTRLLERQPDHVEALQLLATRYFRMAEAQPEQRVFLMGRGRSFLARAYQADPDNYYTLILLGQSREGMSGYPNDNDLATWSQAFDLSPQLPASRLGLARALMQAGRGSEAAQILPVLANAPHGGPATDAAKVLLARALAGQAPLSEAEITAATDGQVEKGPDQPPPSGDDTPRRAGPTGGSASPQEDPGA